MAQLKDSIVSGNLRVTDETLTDSIQTNTIKIPVTSGSTTFGPGNAGQLVKTNGTTAYWATPAKESIGSASGWSAGTTPTLGTVITADDITSWSEGTLPSLNTSSWTIYPVTSNTTTATNVVTKNWTIPNVTNAGTAPTLTTKDTTFYPCTSSTTTATKVVTSSWTIPNVTSVGTTPTLGTAITADDITSWSAGALPELTVTDGILSLSAGTLPTLNYTSRSIPNVTSVGTTPTLGTAFSVVGVSTNSEVAVPVLSSSVKITGVSSWSAGTATTLGTAFTVVGVSTNTSVNVPVLSSSVTVTGVSSWNAGSLPSLAYTPRSIPNVTSVGTAPTLTITSKNVVTGI